MQTKREFVPYPLTDKTNHRLHMQTRFWLLYRSGGDKAMAQAACSGCESITRNLPGSPQTSVRHVTGMSECLGEEAQIK